MDVSEDVASKLVLCRVQYFPDGRVQLARSVTVDFDFSWCLRIGEKQLFSSTSSLASLPSSISSVVALTTVLDFIDSCIVSVQETRIRSMPLSLLWERGCSWMLQEMSDIVCGLLFDYMILLQIQTRWHRPSPLSDGAVYFVWRTCFSWSWHEMSHLPQVLQDAQRNAVSSP